MRRELAFILLGISLLACKHNPKPKEKALTKTNIQAEKKIRKHQIEKKTIDGISTDCKCYNGIGSTENDKPILISKFSNGTSLSLCGYFDKEK